ncbi:MAG: phage repressor protein Serine peptidase family [Rhodoferax sp.]|nr:phage repressor protein Serine peptidase family [Rhodoferax sp.]
MSINTVIREGRRRLGWSEQQFAEAIGVTRGAVQQWEKANGTAPKRATQPRVAQLLGISVAELMTGSNVSSNGEARGEVPLVSEVEAGRYTVIDNFVPKPNLQLGMVPVNVQVQRHTFALRVHGDSMISDSHDSFPEGSVLIIEPDMEALPGDYVIVKNIDGETTFKQLVRDSGEFYLKPLNARYPIKPLGTAEIIGVVREFSKKFR